MNLEKEELMFAGAVAGDRVYSVVDGWGTVAELLKVACFGADIDGKPVFGPGLEVDFDRGFSDVFSLEGKAHCLDINPTLFWDEVKIEIPKRPAKALHIKDILVSELKALKPCVGAGSVLLCWNLKKKKVGALRVGSSIIATEVDAFTEESARNFLRRIERFQGIITEKMFTEAFAEAFAEVGTSTRVATDEKSGSKVLDTATLGSLR